VSVVRKSEQKVERDLRNLFLIFDFCPQNLFIKDTFFVLCQVIRPLSQPQAPVHTPLLGHQVRLKKNLKNF
jgi:hypothetical protein